MMELINVFNVDLMKIIKREYYMKINVYYVHLIVIIVMIILINLNIIHYLIHFSMIIFLNNV